MKTSDATYKLLVSPTPIVGPDRGKKNDNHANRGFTYEGDQVRQFIGEHDNMFIICGDRHWQYASVDPKTGAREFACGSASDAHAGGFKEEMRSEMHRYLKIIGGFLSVHVEQINGKPSIAFRHHNVDGEVVNEINW
jgi:alkaline phosphatase D